MKKSLLIIIPLVFSIGISIFSYVRIPHVIPGLECIWGGTGIAFVDQDRNGVRDDGEPMLEGVQFYVDDVFNNYEKVGHAITNRWGEAGLGVGLPGCPTVAFEVYVEVPEGYELTSSPRLYAGLGARDSTFEFGFWPVR